MEEGAKIQVPLPARELPHNDDALRRTTHTARAVEVESAAPPDIRRQLAQAGRSGYSFGRLNVGHRADSFQASDEADQARDAMGAAFNADFSAVRLHASSPTAVALGTRAFAQGEEIHFAPGQFSPHTEAGRALIGHEFAHIVQQREGCVAPTHLLGKDLPANLLPGLEDEADRLGKRAARGERVRSRRAPAAARHGQTVVQGSLGYTASVVLDRTSAAKQPASSFVIQGIMLPPKGRPPTQFGIDQKAHSVSWTLLMRSYETVRDTNVTDFIDSYLKPDWNELRKQTTFFKINNEAHEQLASYFQRYTDDYFTTMKADNRSILQWHGKLRQAITDYFTAVQLAPLSTHLGYMQKLGTQEIKDSRPTSHGEASANEELQAVEAALGAGNLILETDDTHEGQKVRVLATLLGKRVTQFDVIASALRYWDPGVDMVGGLDTEAKVELVKDKLLISLRRAYPKTMAAYEKDLVQIINANLVDAFTLRGRYSTAPVKSTAKSAETSKDEEEADIDNANGVFQANLTLAESTSGGGAALLPAAAYAISEYTITEISLPTARIETKFGRAGQKSHTVAWTLVLKELRALPRDSLKALLSALLSKWMTIQSQDWDSMINTDLITSDDLKDARTETVKDNNKRNRQRLTALKAIIAPTIQSLADAISGRTLKSDVEWSTFINTVLSQFVTVSQSAPLTTVRQGIAKGKGEKDANDSLLPLEEKSLENENWWATKFIATFFKKKKTLPSAWKGDARDKDEGHRIAMDKSSSDPNKLKRNKMLVRELAAKYRDFNWSSIKSLGGNNLTLLNSPRMMAKLLVDWEEAMEAAFPNLWKEYSAEFIGDSERMLLSDSLKNEQSSGVSPIVPSVASASDKGLVDEEQPYDDAATNYDATMRGWVRRERAIREYRRGLIAMIGGDTAVDDSQHESYRQAKLDYIQGVNDVSKGILQAAVRQAYKRGYEQYLEGLQQVRLISPAPPGEPAFAQAAQEYWKMLKDLALGNNPDPLTSAQKHAHHDYVDGQALARARQTANNVGQFEALNHYTQGLDAAKNERLDRVGKPIAYQEAVLDYEHGLNDAKNSRVQVTYINLGYQDAVADFQRGETDYLTNKNEVDDPNQSYGFNYAKRYFSRAETKRDLNEFRDDRGDYLSDDDDNSQQTKKRVRSTTISTIGTMMDFS